MLRTILKKNTYQDSIILMLLTNSVSALPGVNKLQVMMGSDANKDIFKSAGLLTDEAAAAGSNDMIMVLDVDNEDTAAAAVKEMEAFLNNLSAQKTGSVKTARSWDQAVDMLPDANVALFSVPGTYAAPEIENALNRSLHAFVFSDNVSLEDEVCLKKMAHEKGLLVMGPDCGTGIVGGVPLAFTNEIRTGNIGIVGASGTGIQEVSTIIDRLGGGVIHAIGTGGRDLSEAVGAITMKDALIGLAEYEPVDVIVVISKPPAKQVRDEVVQILQSIDKAVVAIFLGENPASHEGNVYFAHTMDEAAAMAVDLASGRTVRDHYQTKLDTTVTEALPDSLGVKGLYSGGTLASEAAMLISEALELGAFTKKDGYVFHTGGFEILDLGDDMYTQGKPHPMIDPETRIKKIKEFAADESTGVILLDIVLGHGSHEDMAGALAPSIREALANAREQNRALYFIGSVCGSKKDPQNYDKTRETLLAAGMLLEDTNAKAVRLALAMMGKESVEQTKNWEPYAGGIMALPKAAKPVAALLAAKPKVVNIGISSFADTIPHSVRYEWKPAAGGNLKLIKILAEVRKLENLQQQNDHVIGDYINAAPYLIDVVPAHTVIPELCERVLLHAGPPISYADMTSPMQGSCIGAALFEGWAEDEAGAKMLLEGGQIRFIPCHHVQAVGPMGGITSANMPVLVVENRLKGNRSYCTMNEGIGKVLRFGAYDQEVVDRLNWMKDTLGTVLGEALRAIDGGINMSMIIAKAITMGDEFHQRNIAASLLFLKEITPTIVSLDIGETKKREVIEFLAKTEQFFLNIMMATGKAIVDGARTFEHGTVVTTMTRNGKDFAIRVSGLGDRWFTAPVNTPQGLFFTGFTQDDANPDIGDSAITETVGVGAMSMIAAPGVVRFVGAGGLDDAKRFSDEMDEITVSNNPNWSIPTWDFKGAPLGIDICRVVETGITPLINTGIAHKKAGYGQVGAGTVRAPLACFEKALIAYAEHMGIQTDTLD